MATTTPPDTVAEDARKPRHNWWKWAFFFMLFAFEVTREIAVMQTADGAQPSAIAGVYGSGDFVSASGRWWRIDDGSQMVPGTVRIECNAASGECIEASVIIMDGKYVMPPEIDHFPATFTPDAVTYTNDIPDCARYTVRIDLVMKKVFAVREKKEHVTNDLCKKLEPRIEMQLGDGYNSKDGEAELHKHFLPIFQLVAAIF